MESSKDKNSNWPIDSDDLHAVLQNPHIVDHEFNNKNVQSLLLDTFGGDELWIVLEANLPMKRKRSWFGQGMPSIQKIGLPQALLSRTLGSVQVGWPWVWPAWIRLYNLIIHMWSHSFFWRCAACVIVPPNIWPTSFSCRPRTKPLKQMSMWTNWHWHSTFEQVVYVLQCLTWNQHQWKTTGVACPYQRAPMEIHGSPNANPLIIVT